MTQQVQRDQGGSAPDTTAMDQGMRVLAYLISGVLLYGGLGWVGDHYLHTQFLLPVGIVLGAGLGIYSTIRRLAAMDVATRPADASATTKEGDR